MLVDQDLTMYFQSDRASGIGSSDLYLARRASVGEAFAAPELITELCSLLSDTDPWVAPDQRTIYFASDRSGNMEIYQATR
jgi:Tol biopolymer transport system component